MPYATMLGCPCREVDNASVRIQELEEDLAREHEVCVVQQMNELVSFCCHGFGYVLDFAGIRVMSSLFLMWCDLYSFHRRWLLGRPSMTRRFSSVV